MIDEGKTALITFSIKYRGVILHQVSMLEIMIDMFIANHFCKDEEAKRQFLKFVLNSKIIIFENKRGILKKIIDESHPVFVKKIPDYYAKLGKIRDVRNAFAHNQVDISEEGVELFKKSGNIILIDGSKDRKEYMIAELDKTVETIRKMCGEVAMIMGY